MTVPAAAACTLVPLGTPMSTPGCRVPQRMPKGLVIGPETGQMKPPLLTGAGSPDEEAADPDDAAFACCSDSRIFAASAALEAASAFDSSIVSCSCCLVATRSCDLPERALAS